MCSCKGRCPLSPEEGNRTWVLRTKFKSSTSVWIIFPAHCYKNFYKWIYENSILISKHKYYFHYIPLNGILNYLSLFWYCSVVHCKDKEHKWMKRLVSAPPVWVLPHCSVRPNCTKQPFLQIFCITYLLCLEKINFIGESVYLINKYWFLMKYKLEAICFLNIPERLDYKGDS